MKPTIVVIANNIRSAHNIGSLFRSANGLGVKMLYISGYSPYPKTEEDKRLPHVQIRATNQIAKTALGAELSTSWQYVENPIELLEQLRSEGFSLVALDQSKRSVPLQTFKSPSKVALILGSEIGGIDKELIDLAETIIEIPMLGSKNSLNVAISAAIALYHLRYFSAS